jgi:hypothetical protein
VLLYIRGQNSSFTGLIRRVLRHNRVSFGFIAEQVTSSTHLGSRGLAAFLRSPTPAPSFGFASEVIFPRRSETHHPPEPCSIVDALLIRHILVGTLQFCFIKPVIAATVIALSLTGYYKDGDLSLTNNGYPYIVIIYNTSITVALYALLMFYGATKEHLKYVLAANHCFFIGRRLD